MKRHSVSDRILLIFVYSALSIMTCISILPFMQVVTVSMSPVEEINRYGFHFIPTVFDFSGYKFVFSNDLIWGAYKNTILRTLIGVTITVFLTFLGAYPLSKKTLPHRKLWTILIVFTMFFQGGMIPSYLLVKELGLMNTMGALVLPGAVSVFLLLIVRNFVSGLPESLEESAKMDGANDIIILFKIVLPLSLPIIATIGLYSAVGHWNAWFDSMIYIQDQKKQVLQIVLRQIILEGQNPAVEVNGGQVVDYQNIDAIKMATLVIAILPIVCVYPFLQKYFIKGSLVGAVKG